MFENVPATGIQPAGPIVYTAQTSGATGRPGRSVEIRDDGSFRVFVAGRFVAGMRTLDQAIARAELIGVTDVDDPRRRGHSVIAVGTRRVNGGRNGRDYRYIGVLRDGLAVLAECGHEHANRGAGGDSATDCIRMVLRATARDTIRDQVAEVYRRAWQNLARHGFQQTAETIARAKADAEANAEAFLALVDEVAALLAARGLRVNLGGCFSATRIVPAQPE